MEKWDEKIQDNLHGSQFLQTWNDLPYKLKEIIAESFNELNMETEKMCDIK